MRIKAGWWLYVPNNKCRNFSNAALVECGPQIVEVMEDGEVLVSGSGQWFSIDDAERWGTFVKRIKIKKLLRKKKWQSKT